MTFAQSGSSITQSGTDTDLSGLTGVTGVTTTTVGDVTVYVIASNNLVITGTCTFDPTMEMVCITSTTIGNALYINGGTLNIGSEVTSSLGTGLKPLYQPATAFIIGTESTAATSGYCINVTATGTLNWYGAIISVNSSQVWADGATIKIRDGVLFSRRFSTNNRIRIEGGTNVDVDGLTTYGIQADWLITEDFGQFANYTALDKSIPTECALGTAGERAWETLPDNSHAADASMSNWKAFLDITITNAEVGSRSLIVPDNTNAANGSTFHGGRLYHEFTVSCKDTLNAPIESAVCYLSDYNNGMRVTTDSYSTGIDIDETDDQVFTPLTDSNGITSVQTLLTAMYYRTNGVDDINIPDGQERVDYRGKPKAVNASIGSVSTVSATFGSTDASLPALTEGTRFVLEDSTSNDEQTWETTEDWTTSGGDADRLNGNATAETENAMSMSVLGEDSYDVYVWSYEHLPYKFTDATMNGLTQSDLVATMLPDLGVTQTNRTTVGAYTTLDDLSELYDYQKDYKCDTSNVTEPSIDTSIAVASGTIVDFGDIDVVIDGDAASVFVFTAGTPDTVTIKTTDLTVSSKFNILKTTESVTIQDGAVVSGGITIDGDMNLDGAEDLSDVTVTGDLNIDTGTSGSEITAVGSTEAVSTGEDDEITIAYPGSTQADDVAYMAVGHAQSGENAWNTPSGWVIPTGLTEVQTGGTPASTPGVSVFRRVLDGGEGANVTVTNAGTNTSGIVAQMLVFRGVDTTTPEDVTPTTASGASGDPNPASITPVNDSTVLTFGFQDDGDQTSPTQPSGYTAAQDTATLDGAGTGE